MKSILRTLACYGLFMSGISYGAPAVVINSQGCNLVNSSGSIQSFPLSKVKIVKTNAPNNVTILKCYVKNMSNVTGQAVHWSYANLPVLCNTTNGVTKDWHETISASGNAVLTCKVKN